MAAEQRIGIVIRRARERKRWTQKDLANALGVSRQSVDSWENDRVWPRNSIGALEQVLGISLNGTPAPRPLADLEPFDEWEADVAGRTSIPEDDRRWLITESRRARAEAVRLRRQDRAAAEAESARNGRGTGAA